MADDGDETLGQSVIANVRHLFGYCFKPSMPEPAVPVVDLLIEMKLTPRQVRHFHRTFLQLKEYDSLTQSVGPHSATVTSMSRLVKRERRWVTKILYLMLDLAGFPGQISWDGFLFVFIQFCRLSKLELSQLLFFIILKSMKSWTVHYLTNSQLSEFFDAWKECPVVAFSTKGIDFKQLDLACYNMHDFVKLVFRFHALISPFVHLQRSVQMALPSLRFWEDVDHIVPSNKRITIDFLNYNKIDAIDSLTKKVIHDIHGEDLEDGSLLESLEVAAEEMREKDCDDGYLPLPQGMEKPPRVKMSWESEPSPWLKEFVLQNIDPRRGIELGSAVQTEVRPAHLPFQPSSNDPRSVDEAKALILTSYGATGRRAVKAEQESPKKQVDVVKLQRAQDLEFIRRSREVVDARFKVSVLSILHASNQCELLNRSKT